VFSTRRASVPALFSVSFSALVLAPAAFSASPQHGQVTSLAQVPAAISEYVEVVPTSGGDAAVGVGKPTVKPLPAPTEKAVAESAGTAAPALEQVATSSVYGAPTTKLPIERDSSHVAVVHVLHPARSASPSVPSLGAVSLGGGDSQRLYWLAAILVLSTCVLVGAALRHRRV
jgi:hypothetical protein